MTTTDADAADDTATGGDRPGDRDDPAPRGPRPALVVGGLTAVVVLPLVIALAALATPRWYPLLDLAMTELRVRDVGTRHTPLVGLVGRLSSGGVQGSHPGPLSFWALAPVYRLLGGSAWSLFVGVVVLNTTAIALTLWAAFRQGGTRLALAFAAGTAVLLHIYGTQVLTEPWNPYMPVMWWLLTLVAVWAVACDDLAMLPVAVFAASFCMQTHISYVGLIGGFTAVGLVALALRAHRLRADRAARNRLLRWAGVAAGLGVVLWLPPLIDQITGDPGNASIVLDHFRHAEEDTIAFGRAVELYAVHLNPWRFVSGQHAISGSVLPGALLVLAWAASAVATWRRRPTAPAALVRLHAVLAIALALGFVSSTRIIGFVWFYLTLWALSITMLLLVAIGWTLVTLAAARGRAPAGEPAPRPAVAPPLAARLGATALALVLVAWTAMFSLDAADAEPTQANYSAMVGEFTEAVTAAIDDGEVEGGGPDGRYLITWTDGVNLGSTGFGLLTELERRGYDVGVISSHGPGAREHRVLPAAEATAEIHISLGPDIPVWQAKPEAEQVAYVDLRTDEQVAQYEQARLEAIEHLERLGRDELLPLVDEAPFLLWIDDSLPQETLDVIQVLADVGQPAALFVAPVTPGW